jgi:hypothetical protein
MAFLLLQSAASSDSVVRPGDENVQTFDWTTVSSGVQATQDGMAAGNDVFLGFAGWTVQQEWVNTWISALDSARLHALGVRYLYAVKGPLDADYASREIGTAALARHLVALVSATPSIRRIIVAAHSSGSYVAHEFLHYLYESPAVDSLGVTDTKIVYFNLDGGIGAGGSGFPISQTIANHLGHIYAVYAADGATGILSPNHAEMEQLGAMFGTTSQQMKLWVNGSGCTAQWCVHETLITLHPHKTTTYDLQNDYTDFSATHPVSTGYLEFLTAVDEHGRSNGTPVFILRQNVPNPFNPSTTIDYTIGPGGWGVGSAGGRASGGIVNSQSTMVNQRAGTSYAWVRLSVFDLLGREVAMLVNENEEPGNYTVTWDARGKASGVYFYCLIAGEQHDIKKMVMLR